MNRNLNEETLFEIEIFVTLLNNLCTLSELK